MLLCHFNVKLLHFKLLCYLLKYFIILLQLNSFIVYLCFEDHMEVWVEAMSSFGLKYSLDYKDKIRLPEIIPG